MPRKKLALHWQILVGLFVGAAMGFAANGLAARQIVPGMVNTIASIADPLGKVFLRLIFMVVIPLVFSALALGVAGLGDTRRPGRVGLRALLFTIGLSACAVALGITLVNTIQPGRYLSESQQAQLNEQYGADAQNELMAAKQAEPLKDILLDIIPENPIQQMVVVVDGSSKGNGMPGGGVFFTGLWRRHDRRAGENADTQECPGGIFRRVHGDHRLRDVAGALRSGVPRVRHDGPPRVRPDAASSGLHRHRAPGSCAANGEGFRDSESAGFKMMPRRMSEAHDV